MAGEEQYYHPIIQAMLQRGQNQLEQERMAEAAKTHGVQLKLEQQAQDRAERDLNNRVDFQNRSLDIQNEVHKLAREHQLFTQHHQNIQDINSGAVDPATGEANTPDVLGGIKANNAAKEITAVGNAQEPFFKAHTQMQADKEKEAALNKFNYDILLAKQRGMQDEHLAGVKAGYETSLHNLEGDYRLKGIALAQGMGSPDPESAQHITENEGKSILTGQGSFDKIPYKGLKSLLQQNFASRGWLLPTDQKDYNTGLDAYRSGDKVLNLATELANEYSSDQPKGGFINSMAKGQIPGVIPNSELNSKQDALAAEVGGLATTLDKSKRLNDPEVKRKLKGLFNASNNKQQNLDNIGGIRKLLDETLGNSLKGMPADQKNYILGNIGVTNFGGHVDPPVSEQQTAPAPGGTPAQVPGQVPTGRPIRKWDPQNGLSNVVVPNAQ